MGDNGLWLPHFLWFYEVLMTSCTESWWLDIPPQNPTQETELHKVLRLGIRHSLRILMMDAQATMQQCWEVKTLRSVHWCAFLGSPGCRGAGLVTQEQITLKQDYPIIRPLPRAPTHHTRTCSCLLSTTWCISSKDSSTTLLRLSSHENYELNKSFVFKSLSLGYFVTARKKNEQRC